MRQCTGNQQRRERSGSWTCASPRRKRLPRGSAHLHRKRDSRPRSAARSATAGASARTMSSSAQRILNAKGWAVPRWPVEWGGQPAGRPVQRYIFMEEMQQAPCRRRLPFNFDMVGPVIARLRHRGAEAPLPAAHRQSRRLVVPGLLRAGRRLRPRLAEDHGAMRDGDHYVVNGQKTWTTLAQHADWIFCLVRTDPTRQEAGGHLLPPDRHEDARHHRAADHHHRRRARGQRGVLRRRAGAGREPGRRGEQGLGLRQVPARQRAHRHRPHRRVQAAPAPHQASSPSATPAGDGTVWDDPRFREQLARVEVELKALEITQLRVVAAERKRERRQAATRPPRSSRSRARSSSRRRPSCCSRWPARYALSSCAPAAMTKAATIRRRARLGGAVAPDLLQLPQGLDLRRLERDPAQHHRQGDPWPDS